MKAKTVSIRLFDGDGNVVENSVNCYLRGLMDSVELVSIHYGYEGPKHAGLDRDYTPIAYPTHSVLVVTSEG